MVLKKKFLGGYGLLFGLFCCLFVSFLFTNCYATETLTPINEMTPEIAQELFDYFHDNNSFYYIQNTSQPVYENFYSQINATKLQSFCDEWNNFDFTGRADYLEQVVFTLMGYNNHCYLYLLYNNNQIGNTLPYLKMTNNMQRYFYYRDDAGNNVTGLVDYWNFNDVGTCTYGWPQNMVSNGLSLYYPVGNPDSYNSSNNTFYSPIICCYHLSSTIFYSINSGSSYSWYELSGSSVLDYVGNNEPVDPDNPVIPDDTGNTGQITDNQGDVTGNIDLTGIQNSLGNIDTTTQNIESNTETIIEHQQQIQAGLTTPPDMSETEIDSSDITDALDFNFPTDPYANFWLTLTTGLSGALTGNKRSIDITFRGTTYTISLDNFTLQVPSSLKTILTLFSTTFVFWILIKWWKIILDKITSGDVDELLSMNEEERHY